MPVYPKKRGGKTIKDEWRIVLSVKGQQIERNLHGSKKEANAYEARLRRDLEVGVVLESRTAPRCSAFCLEQYAPHAVLHLRKTTWSVRRYHLATLISTIVEPGPAGRALGELRLTELREGHIDTYKAARTAAGRKPRSVNNELACLQAVLAYAHEIKVPCASPKIEHLPVIGRGRVTFWHDAQIGALFASLEEHAPEIMGPVVFLANTGCRSGEAIAAEKPWIDLKRGLITITPNEYWQPKDNEPREIPISDALRPWLERALGTERAKKSGTRFAEAQEEPAYLYPSRTGTRFAFWPKLQFNRARKLAGRCAACRKEDPDGKKTLRCKACAPQLRGGPHTLRHTFASHFLAACPDIWLLAQVLGHSEARTSKIYAHLLPGHLERARNAVNLAPAVGPAALEAKKRWKAG